MYKSFTGDKKSEIKINFKEQNIKSTFMAIVEFRFKLKKCLDGECIINTLIFRLAE